MLAQTSLLAYRHVTNDEAKLTDKQQKVFEAVEAMGSASNEDIADYLKWPINRVTGRVSELRYKGVLGVEGVKKSKAGFSAKVWSVRNPELKLKELDCEG